MSYQKEFEEAFNIIAPEYRKLGLTDDEISNTYTKSNWRYGKRTFRKIK